MSIKQYLFILSAFFLNSYPSFAVTTTSPADCKTLLSILEIPIDTVNLQSDQVLVPADLVIGPVQSGVDYSDLIGMKVVGRIEYGREQRNEYVNGVIRSVQLSRGAYDLPQLDATVQSESGEQVLHFKNQDSYDYMLKIYMVRSSSPEQISTNFPERLLRQLFRENFKLEMEPQDFATASVLVQTYLSLPGNYGANGTVDTLLGKSSKTAQHTNFGNLQSNKRYSKKGLVATVLWLRMWMEWNYVISLTEPSAESDPSWLRAKKSESNAAAYVQWIERLAENVHIK